MKPSQKTVRCIDWSQIIRDLEACGMSLREIGTACDKGDLSDGGKTWAYALKNIPGTEPKFHDGALLLALWSDQVSEASKDVSIQDAVSEQFALFPTTTAWQRHAAEGAGDMMLTAKCTLCGASLKGRRLLAWRQLQLHHHSHGDQSARPSWLDPVLAKN